MIDPAPDRAPRAPMRDTRLEHDGDTRDDPWYWLRERDDPEVLAYLEAENAYTATTLAHLAPVRDALYAEIVARVQETDASAPARQGPYEYFSRTIEG
ncbi:MAG TPA: S9 family peptidase, partial [Gaiellaceae bacterium]|nr:S9 family peptidase [Gaiellaceae bacterium]